MKVFTHCPLATPLPELTAETTEDGRHYTTPEGNVYASVTTILGLLKKDHLDIWRAKVGEEKAKEICDYAANRGTELHAVLEAYLKNEQLVFPEDKKSRVKIMFNRMARVLDNVDNIVGQELGLYSDTLKTAGRTDLIAEYYGIPSVIDFKGSTQGKREDWIETYFLQVTCYSMMLEERTGLIVPQIVIMMCGEKDFSCQVFVKQRDAYIDRLKDVMEKYSC